MVALLAFPICQVMDGVQGLIPCFRNYNLHITKDVLCEKLMQGWDLDSSQNILLCVPCAYETFCETVGDWKLKSVFNNFNGHD